MSEIKKTLNSEHQEKKNDYTIDESDKKINELKINLENAQKKINNIKLRQLAEIENITKSAQYQIEQEKNEERKRFFKKTLSIIDSFEETLILAKKLKLQDEPIIQGIELTLTSLLQSLCKFGISIEGQKNEIFNPKLHNATSKKSSDTVEDNHILDIHQKGYTFKKNLLRKAIVTISKNKKK